MFLSWDGLGNKLICLLTDELTVCLILKKKKPLGNCVFKRLGVRERREADVGLHIEKFLAAGDEDKRRGGGKKGRQR